MRVCMHVCVCMYAGRGETTSIETAIENQDDAVIHVYYVFSKVEC